MTPDPDAATATPIVLVGPPGSGKTTIGRLLAADLGADFIDVDELISERTGKTITEIFSEDGEPHFRQLERATTIETIEAARQHPPTVISLGGGAPTDEPVRDALAGSRVVWLRVGIAAGAKRVGLNTARPLLLGNVRGQMIKLMRQREPYYASVSQIGIDTDDRSPQELTASIAELL
jgi:shikimate kinase